MVALGKYPADANAMLTPIKGLMDSIKQSDDSGTPVDTLLLAGGAEVLPQIGPLITYSGLNNAQIKIIGTGGWDYPNAGRNAALAGGWYPAPIRMAGRISRSASRARSAPRRRASQLFPMML